MAKNYSLDNKYTFPSDNIDPELKKKSDYSLKCAKAAYGIHQKTE